MRIKECNLNDRLTFEEKCLIRARIETMALSNNTIIDQNGRLMLSKTVGVYNFGTMLGVEMVYCLLRIFWLHIGAYQWNTVLFEMLRFVVYLLWEDECSEWAGLGAI